MFQREKVAAGLSGNVTEKSDREQDAYLLLANGNTTGNETAPRDSTVSLIV